MDEQELKRIVHATQRRFESDLVCCGTLEDVRNLVNEVRVLRNALLTLPLVSPDNLIDGEWYVVELDPGHTSLGRRGVSRFPSGRHVIWAEGVDYWPDNIVAIHGPLPKFKLEEK